MKTLKEIMTEAHKIARTLEGNYTARLSEGLKVAWSNREAKNINTTTQEIKKQILMSFDINGRVNVSWGNTAEEVFAHWFKSGLWSEKIMTTVIKYRKISEKQAYVMANDFAKNMNNDEINALLSVGYIN